MCKMITLIVNPTAGSGRSKRVAISVEEQLKQKDLPHRIWETNAPGAAEALARMAAENHAPGDFLLSIGGGIHISPEADPQSGKLELIVIKGCSRLRMMSYLPGLLGGKILNFKDTVVHCRAETVSVKPLGA